MLVSYLSTRASLRKIHMAPVVTYLRRSRLIWAQGNDLTTAIRKAKHYLSAAIAAAAAQHLGKGHGPVEHFFTI